MASHLLTLQEQNELVARFNELVTYASNFAYYRNSWGKNLLSGISSISDIAKFPIVEKSKLINSELVTEVLSQQIPSYFETSGTSGKPFPVIANLSTEKSKAFALALDKWMSLTKDQVKKAIIALPYELNPVGLKYHLALNYLGITPIAVGVRTHICPPKKVLQIIDRLQPELLVGRPLEILRYAEAMDIEGQDAARSSIKKIIFTGEIVSENKWKRISKVYGNARVEGVYGLTELDSGGLISCSKHKYKYHLPPVPYLLVEVLKDDLKTSVCDGEIGNIIITNTEKTHLPLIRYNTGDAGRLHAACDCELNTPSIEVMGRSTDNIRSATANIYPIQIENILFQYDEISADYQLLLEENEITLRIEISKSSKSDINDFVQQLESEIYEKLGLPVKIHSYHLGELANKLGIAKDKAGKLYILDGLTQEQINEILEINYC